MLIRRYWKKILLSTIAIILIAAAILAYLYFHNFHTVVPDAVYRSNQLTKTEFAKAIETHHIKTIINLRRDYPADWYNDEMAISQEKGVKHEDVGMGAYSLPDPAVLAQLVKTLETAEKPILIHCQGGSDRSGLASAIVLILNGETSLSAVNRQTSYFPYFVIHSDSVGKQVLERYEAWLTLNHLSSSRQNFLDWVALVQVVGWDAMENKTEKI
jgi:protein tyrosine phosphatase (PTP) superfamily phosphohydrolase (DUF442 family)